MPRRRFRAKSRFIALDDRSLRMTTGRPKRAYATASVTWCGPALSITVTPLAAAAASTRS